MYSRSCDCGFTPVNHVSADGVLAQQGNAAVSQERVSHAGHQHTPSRHSCAPGVGICPRKGKIDHAAVACLSTPILSSSEGGGGSVCLYAARDVVVVQGLQEITLQWSTVGCGGVEAHGACSSGNMAILDRAHYCVFAHPPTPSFFNFDRKGVYSRSCDCGFTPVNHVSADGVLAQQGNAAVSQERVSHAGHQHTPSRHSCAPGVGICPRKGKIDHAAVACLSTPILSSSEGGGGSVCLYATRDVFLIRHLT